LIIIKNFANSQLADGFVKSSPAKVGQSPQKRITVGAIHESPLRVRRSGEAAAQSRSERDRWTS
jgi:hypothetical protein